MAGAGRRTFQPGEVLTASNVNSYLMDQSVMRFASSAARGSAVGTAVIAEGMVSYLDDVNFLQVYDGSGWRTIGGVQSLANVSARDNLLTAPKQGDLVYRDDTGYDQRYFAAYGTANPGGRAGGGWVNDPISGITPIAPTSVTYVTGSGSTGPQGDMTVTACSKIEVNGVFSNLFRNYMVIYDANASAGNNLVYMRMRTTSDETASSYYFGGNQVTHTGTASAWSSAGVSSNFIINYTGTDKMQATINVFSPQVSGSKTGAAWQAFGDNTSVYIGNTVSGVVVTNTSYTGFSIYVVSGTFTGKVQVFGYNY